MSEKKYAVVDKISEGWATVLLEDEPGKKKAMVVKCSAFPEKIKEGDWLVMSENGSFFLDSDKTRERRDRIKDKLSMLRKNVN